MHAVLPGERRLTDPVIDYVRTDFACLYQHQTISEALDAIRNKPPEGQIIYFYVLDKQNRLTGVVPTRRLLLNPPEHRIEDIMFTEVISIPDHASVLEACEYFTFHRLLAFPVVDQDLHLKGIVDVELYTSELSDLERNEGNEELFQLIGMHLADTQHSSPAKAFRIRFPWLIANIAGGILSAFLSGIFAAELKQAVALALFIPVVLALAESVSIQSVSLALQALRNQKTTLAAVFQRLHAEFATGLMLGSACAICIASVALVWLGEVEVVLCLLGGITGGVAGATVIGSIIPKLLRYFQHEPQVAAGPIALAMTDILTLLIYFSIARWLLG
ncbi:magnesium transporter [Gimesia chilikensis]|uniref:magnesium transporter n=1 Tax=Gimesia chilikensis TaxID=2605989 RepID=UPI003A905F56